MDFLKFTADKLHVEEICDLVTSAKCGAISTFIGTTRDNFEDKEVVKLEYEAYETMGLKAMKAICEQIRNRWSDVANIAIYHRLGTVPVKEASIVIAISSPHRADAIKATEYCIDNVKKSVPIWKKEVYHESSAVWKENKESPIPSKTRKFKVLIEPELEVPVIPQHLIQIRATNEEIDERIERFMERKRGEVNQSNIRDFCRRAHEIEVEFSCARIDSVLKKRKDSKGHLQVNKVYNKCMDRDQSGSEYLQKHIPKNGVHERLSSLETQLCLDRAVPKEIYKRLKLLEDRLMYLETISPEYIQFWDKTSLTTKTQKRKKIFSIKEIDNLIAAAEKRRKT